MNPRGNGQDVTLAVDIGGTFTDVILLDSEGRLWEHKLPTSTMDEGAAVVDGAQAVLERADVAPASVTEVIHASTVATNAVLEKKGPAVGLITTEGFRDVLEIARIRGPKLYDLKWDKPKPLALRRNRYEVKERIDFSGQVVTELDEESVYKAVRQIKSDGLQTIAVCLINSPKNRQHEDRVTEIIEETHPDAFYSVSSDVFPELKEYERTSTTVVDAYLKPVMDRYLTRLADKLAARGITAPLHVMRSDGSLASAEVVASEPVGAVISGPAAGVTATQVVAQRTNSANLLAFDMGGTTAKCTLVEDGRIPRVNEYEIRDGVSTPSRLVKAGGHLLMVPAVDLAEVGNGAGSVARIDAGGALRVGPESAGAVPGPACYGQGGTEPTITDANVLLGYLNPNALVGGALEMEVSLAEAAIRNEIAEPLGVSTLEAAWAIHALANSNMIKAMRAVTVERGRDPRAATLVAFGGSGPVHGANIADQMKISRVIVPQFAGLFSAIGLLASNTEQHMTLSWRRSADDTPEQEIENAFDQLELQVKKGLASEGHELSSFLKMIDIHYSGQAGSLQIEFKGSLADTVERFEKEYKTTYGHLPEGEPVEFVTLRGIGQAPSRRRHVSASVMAGAGQSASTRRVQFGVDKATARILQRDDLRSGSAQGPLLVDEYDTTVVIPPHWSAKINNDGDLVMERTT